MKFLFLICGALLAFTSWSFIYPEYTYQYRITIEIQTPRGVSVGKSVIQVTTQQFPSWLTLGNKKSSIKLKGEAVFVDAGEHKSAVMLITDLFEVLAPKVFLGEDPMSDVERAKELLKMQGSEKEVPFEVMPTLIAFKNVDDASSAKILYSKLQNNELDGVENNFPLLFGDGYNLLRVKLALVDEPATEGELQKSLPFMLHDRRYAIKVWEKINGAAGVKGSQEPKMLFIRN